MTELDFDELDKAVNSLMGDVAKKDDDTKPNTTLDINTTLAPNESPTYDNLNTVAKKIGSETIVNGKEKTLSLTAPPKGGRFMDVIRPPLDMKRAVSKTASPISRVGASVPEPTTTPPGLDLPPADTTAGNLPALFESPEEVDQPEPAVVAPEPLSSPFLPDAKVEKRPLGTASSGASVDVPEPTPVEDDELEATKDDSSVMDARSNPVSSLDEVTTHVPEEFQDALLAVEKGVTEHPSAAEITEEAEGEVPLIGTASIPKQYQEKPSTGDAGNGSIYDTKDYHQPLAHPIKKKSGWLWVLVIIVILVVGAAVGTAVYYLTH